MIQPRIAKEQKKQSYDTAQDCQEIQQMISNNNPAIEVTASVTLEHLMSLK